MQRAEKEFLDFQKNMKTVFRHQSGRHLPDLDVTLGFKSWSPGAHFGPMLGPGAAQEIPKTNKDFLENPCALPPFALTPFENLWGEHPFQSMRFTRSLQALPSPERVPSGLNT